jgi:hypothetical protein
MGNRLGHSRHSASSLAKVLNNRTFPISCKEIRIQIEVRRIEWSTTKPSSKVGRLLADIDWPIERHATRVDTWAPVFSRRDTTNRHISGVDGGRARNNKQTPLHFWLRQA